VLGLALAVRVIVVISASHYVPWGDPADYDRHGAVLDYFGQYPQTTLGAPNGASALRVPGYPYFLAVVYRLIGAHYIGAYSHVAGRLVAARLASAAFGAVTVWLIFLIAREALGRRVALWAALVAAVFPPLYYLAGSLLAENLFLPLMLGSVVCVQRLRRPGAAVWRWTVAAGALVGLATMTHKNGIFLLPPLLAGAWTLRPRFSGRALAVPAVLAAATILVLVPWGMRNAAVFGRLLPFGTGEGFSLAGTYNSRASLPDHFQAVWRLPQDTPDYGALFHRRELDEAKLDGELRSRSLRFAGHHLGYLATVVALNAQRLFDLRDRATVSDVSYREMAVPGSQYGTVRLAVYLLLALAIAGAVVAIRRRPTLGTAWLWSVPLLICTTTVSVIGNPRYRAPLDPFLLILAALAIVHWRDLLPARAE
jgi:4-amino-4-deoxy-L-arabinose transferase-like glycosyltransferase